MLELEISAVAYNPTDLFKELQLAVLQMLERNGFFISIDNVTLVQDERDLIIPLNLFWLSYSMGLYYCIEINFDFLLYEPPFA